MIILPNKKLTPWYRDTTTKLLMHMDGADNGTYFKDECGRTITVAGNTCTKTTVKKFGVTSARFNGTGDYLTVPSSTDFNIASSDFTIDLWFYLTAYRATYGSVLISRGSTTGWYLMVTADGTLYWVCSANSIAIQYGTKINLSQLYHVAIVGSGGTGATKTLYVDGTSAGTSANSIVDVDVPIRIGGWDLNTNYPTLGYMDELKYENGVARWTGNFNPPTYPYY